MDKKVVVYGASGYTGQLICEFLREYQIPFIAAGRDRKRIEDGLANVPGIETADYEIEVVSHDVESLAALLKGKEMVCNTVGPFEYFGETVVAAAAKAGCHYMDTTGEQAFMLRMKEQYGEQYKANGKILSPSTAYMYTPLEIAANIVLEDSSIDTIEGGCIASGVPTYGSTQTIFSIFRTPHYYLENNQLIAWERARGWEVNAPGKLLTQLAHPWGGGALPVWFMDDHRVHSAKQMTAFTNRPMFEQVIALQKHYEENIKPLPDDEQEAELAKIGEAMQPGMPPRENKLVHRTTDFVHGIGTGVRRTCVMHTSVPYQLTGVIQAALAAYLLEEKPKKVGFVSACQAAGHHYLLGAMKKFVPLQIDID